MWHQCKLLEEAGEVARAVIGRLEGREGRGDIGQEIGQARLVLSILAAMFDVDPEAEERKALAALEDRAPLLLTKEPE